MKIKINSLSWIMIYSYFIANGLLYSFLFWQGFEINILQYVSPYDLLPSILFILIIPILCLALYFAITAMLIPINEKIDAFFERHSSTSYRKTKLIFNAALQIFCVSVSFALLIFSKTDFSRQVGIVALVSLGIMTLIREKTEIFSDAGKMRDLYLAVLLAIPISIFAYAHYEVELIKKGTKSYIVESDSDCTNEKNNKFRFIASIGNKAFAYSLKDDSLCVFQYNYLHLIDEKKSKPYEPNTVSQNTI